MTTSPTGRAAVASPTDRAGAASADDALRPSGLGRSAILLVVLVAIALSLALPVREFLDQRDRIASLSASNASATTAIAELTAAKARWNDPAFVMAQARARLHLVMPGQTAYIVVEDEPASTPKPESEASWLGSLWTRITGRS